MQSITPSQRREVLIHRPPLIGHRISVSLQPEGNREHNNKGILIGPVEIGCGRYIKWVWCTYCYAFMKWMGMECFEDVF